MSGKSFCISYFVFGSSFICIICIIVTHVNEYRNGKWRIEESHIHTFLMLFCQINDDKAYGLWNELNNIVHYYCSCKWLEWITLMNWKQTLSREIHTIPSPRAKRSIKRPLIRQSVSHHYTIGLNLKFIYIKFSPFIFTYCGKNKVLKM